MESLPQSIFGSAASAGWEGKSLNQCKILNVLFRLIKSHMIRRKYTESFSLGHRHEALDAQGQSDSHMGNSVLHDWYSLQFSKHFEHTGLLI